MQLKSLGMRTRRGGPWYYVTLGGHHLHGLWGVGGYLKDQTSWEQGGSQSVSPGCRRPGWRQRGRPRLQEETEGALEPR